MNKYVKIFLQRGIAFGGFGPIITSIIYAIVAASSGINTITTNQFLIATITTYILAFVVAGCSMFYTIEHWSFIKSSLMHCILLYLSYLLVYVANKWFPFSWVGFLSFTLVFIVGYVIIWLSIYLSLKSQAKKLNEKIKK